MADHTPCTHHTHIDLQGPAATSRTPLIFPTAGGLAHSPHSLSRPLFKLVGRHEAEAEDGARQQTALIGHLV